MPVGNVPSKTGHFGGNGCRACNYFYGVGNDIVYDWNWLAREDMNPLVHLEGPNFVRVINSCYSEVFNFGPFEEKNEIRFEKVQTKAKRSCVEVQVPDLMLLFRIKEEVCNLVLVKSTGINLSEQSGSDYVVLSDM